MRYRVCLNEQFIRQQVKNKTISIKTGCPQDAWTPVWLKSCCKYIKIAVLRCRKFCNKRRKKWQTYAGLLSGPFIVTTPYRNTSRPTNDGIRSHAVYWPEDERFDKNFNQDVQKLLHKLTGHGNSNKCCFDDLFVEPWISWVHFVDDSD